MTEIKSQLSPVQRKDGGYTPPNVTYKVSPILRARKGVPVSHETNFLFEDSTNSFGLPVLEDRVRLRRVNPFKSEEEQKWIEAKLGEDLNINKTENNFFANYRVIIGSSGVPYNLSDPNDLLAVRVLEANIDKICTDPKLSIKDMKITYLYTLGLESEEFDMTLQEADVEEGNMAFWSKFKMDTNALRAVLSLLNTYAPQTSNLKFLQKEVYQLMKADPFSFYQMVNDPDKKYKILYDQALESRSVYHTKDGYVIKGQTIPIAQSKMELINFFKSDKYSEDVNKIKAYIKEYYDSVHKE